MQAARVHEGDQLVYENVPDPAAGAGEVVLVTTSADPRWTDWPP